MKKAAAILVRCTEVERAEITRLAQAHGQSLSRFLVSTAMASAPSTATTASAVVEARGLLQEALRVLGGAAVPPTVVEAPVAPVEAPVAPVEAPVEAPLVEAQVEAQVEAPVVEAPVEAPLVEAQVEAPVEAPVVKPAPVEAPMPVQRPNQRAQECARCGEIVPPGKGWLIKDFDDDDNSMWTVVHKDQSHCDQIRQEKRSAFFAEAAKKAAKKAAIRDALPKLRAIAVRDGEWIPGPRYLEGKRVFLGGHPDIRDEWVVFDGDYVWHVTNCGHASADWSVKNILTGGAGAIGRRLRLTPEIQELIALAS